jgi:hypothetical protein
MSSEARKLHLIEEVLKLKNEAVLIELEAVLKRAGLPNEYMRLSAHDLLGVWSKEDAALIEKAIEEGCEQIHPDDWK